MGTTPIKPAVFIRRSICNRLNDEEFSYDFSTVDILVQDFKKAVYQHFGVRL